MNSAPSLRIPPPEFLTEPGLQRVLAALPEARLVGGCVRDAVAGREVADVDLATPQTPEAVTAKLQEAGLRVVPTGLAHGTVTALARGRPIEITTLRHDIETDGRHAVVAFTDDWQADAARRDFTFNAMSMVPDGRVYDYFGGLDDLSGGRVRFVGDPARRIEEDRLRVLRFFRFQARYGRETPDQETELALAAAASRLGTLSAERIQAELCRILAAPAPGDAVALMERLGVLAAVMAEGFDVPELLRLLAAGAPADPLLRLAALLRGDPAALADRLRLSGADRERLTALRAPPPDPAAGDAALRRLLAATPREVLIGRSWLAGPAWAGLRGRLAAAEPPVFVLEGRDVLALGIAPGPRVGELLRDVRGWWLDGGCIADLAACRAELARRVEAAAGHSFRRPV